MNFVNQPNGAYTAATSGGLGGTALMDAPKATPRDTISAALDGQSNNISGLFDLISKLEAVLGPVLGPPPPNGGNADANPVPTGVLDVLRSHNRSIQYAQARISELIDRLHI